jgi:hypothetical protein
MTKQKQRFTCSWIWDTAVVLADGKVVCGCADPNGDRPIGHLKKDDIHTIWNNPVVQKMRQGLNEGYAPFCLNCGLKEPVDDDYEIPQRPLTMETVPRLFIEPTVVCNISCFKAVCNMTSGITTTRDRKMMPLDEFKELLDKTGKDLVRLDLFNYGDPFVHPKVVDMIEYVKEKFPHIFLYMSTNGLLLNEEKMQRIAKAGMDEITFSVDGPDHETYVKYRRMGDFNRVFSNMKRFVEIKRELNTPFPFINWRYILFKWNSSDEQMERTRELAAEVGVDKLVWEITDHPEEAKSEKYQIGTEAWRNIYHEIWDTSQTCNALPGKKLLATISPVDETIEQRKDEAKTISVEVENTGGATWSKAFPGFRRSVRLGAQLYNAAGDHQIELNHARAFLNHDLKAGEKDIVEIELPAISEPGKYRIRFDMCCEGIDWFDSGGSPVTWRDLQVQ